MIRAKTNHDKSDVTTPICLVCAKELRLNQSEVRRCKGCRYAIYCTEECQRVDWTKNNHRSRELCNNYRQHHERVQREAQLTADYLRDNRTKEIAFTQNLAPAAQELASLEKIYFSRWCSLHVVSLRKAAVATVLNEICRIPAFPDLTGWLFVVKLRPSLWRTDDLDPSTAFFVQEAVLVDVNSPDPGVATHSISLKGDGPWLAKWQRWAADHDVTERLVTTIQIGVLYSIYEWPDSAPIFIPSPDTQHVLASRQLDPVDHLKRCIPTFKAMVLRGHVLGPPNWPAHDDTGFRVGMAKRMGKEWMWMSLTEEEAEQAGYVKYPGVVGSVPQVSR